MTKPWLRRQGYRREIDTRWIRNRILIVCEGEKTEPNYFRAFPTKIDLVKVDVEGLGANTLSLVNTALEKKESAACQDRPYNQVWCVFDRDSFPAGNFNQAFKTAQANGIRVAYSNQCFELWYFLHYHFNDTAIDRHTYGEKLSRLMGRKYDKTDKGMYNLLKDKQPVAIRNAKKLLTRYPECNPEKNDPSTNVHLLVERLNEFISSEAE